MLEGEGGLGGRGGMVVRWRKQDRSNVGGGRERVLEVGSDGREVHEEKRWEGEMEKEYWW